MMFGSNIVPDTTGRALGSADKQWDVYARNIILTGTLSGAGLSTLQAVNEAPDVDSLNIQSGIDANSLALRFQITNPSVGLPTALFKNLAVSFGGINAVDSGNVPINILCNATGTGGLTNLINLYQRGSNSILALGIDDLGRVNSYANGYTNYAFSVSNRADANARWLVDANGNVMWGAGGINGLDVSLGRNAAGLLGLGNGSGGWGNLSLGQLISNVVTGTAPLAVNSTTLVANLNADHLDGADWTAPPAIGSTTPNDVHAALLTASAQIQSTLNDGATPPLSVASAIPVNTLRVKFASDVTIENSVLNNGSGVKHKRVSTGSIAAGASANIQVVWTTPFADGAYTVTVSMFDSFNSGAAQAGLRVLRITQLDAIHVAIYIINDDGANAHTGTLQVTAIRG